MNKYKVEPNIFATNLWAIYCNGEIIYGNIYKSECERKLQELIKEETIEEVLEELDDWFCEVYCRFYGNEDYCSTCKIKNKKHWLLKRKEDE